MIVYPHPRFTLEAAEAALEQARRALCATALGLDYEAPSLTLDDFTVDNGGRLVFEAFIRGLKHVYEEWVVNNPTYGYDHLVDSATHRVLRKVSAGAVDPRALPPLKLYWCVEPEHEEDWFLIARYVRHARRFVAQGERIPIEAELVATLPDRMQKVDDEVFNDCSQLGMYGAGWPTDGAIRSAGGDFIRDISPRAVAIGERVFIEGSIDLEGLQREASRDPQPPTSPPTARVPN